MFTNASMDPPCYQPRNRHEKVWTQEEEEEENRPQVLGIGDLLYILSKHSTYLLLQGERCSIAYHLTFVPFKEKVVFMVLTALSCKLLFQYTYEERF